MAMASCNKICIYGEDDLISEANVIGSGGMGVVSLYKWRKSDRTKGMIQNREVAVKRLEPAASDFKTILDEAKILWGLHEECNYVLRLYGIMKSKNRISLVLEYMKHGNITDFFSQIICSDPCAEVENQRRLLPLRFQVAEQVCEGMRFLHSRNILHCDLKAGNVLLDSSLNAKICDFGLSKIKLLTTRATSTPEISAKGKLKNNPTGTVSHIAPELLCVSARPTYKSDVYSYGILLWELLTSQAPYAGTSCVAVIIKEVSESRRPDIRLLPVDCPDILKSVMTDSWEQNADRRPNFTEIQGCLKNVYDRDTVEDSTTRADELWHRVKEEKVTVPKVIGTRKSYTRSRISPLPFFETQYDRLTQMAPNIVPTIATQDSRSVDNLRHSFDSISESDLCISVDFNNDDNQQLIGPDVKTGRSSPEPIGSTKHSHKRKICIVLGSTFFAVLIAVAGFFYGKYLNVHSASGKECCLNCFNPADPHLQNSCVPGDGNGYSGAQPGSNCSFSCSDGFVLNGTVTEMRCNQDGIWSGPLPYCRKIRQCPELNPPANFGTVQCTNGLYENSKCTFHCDDGYILRLPGDELFYSDTFDVTCIEDSILNFHWTNQEPYCEKVVTCTRPTTDSNVRLSCTPSEEPNIYHNGTTCNLSCANPMALENQDTVAKCQDDGTWNNASEIKCVKGCPHFVDPPKSIHKCTKESLYDSRCTFKCHANFTMVGSDNMVCHTGKWTNGPPRCECPSCRSGDNCSNSVNYLDSWGMWNETNIVVNYDGHAIDCFSPKHVLTKKRSGAMYGCQCRDKKLNKIKQCNDPNSIPQACQKAFVSLVMIMAYNGTYTLPCDADLMPPGC